jgi:hypothetical protein
MPNKLNNLAAVGEPQRKVSQLLSFTNSDKKRFGSVRSKREYEPSYSDRTYPDLSAR